MIPQIFLNEADMTVIANILLDGTFDRKKAFNGYYKKYRRGNYKKTVAFAKELRDAINFQTIRVEQKLK